MKRLQCTLYVKNNDLEKRIVEYLQNFDTIEVIAVFSNEMEMLEKLSHHHPDILFLNAGNSEFDMASFLKIVSKPPFLIGITDKMDMIRQLLDDGFLDVLNPKFSLTEFCRMIGKIISIASSLEKTPSIAHAEEPNVAMKYKVGSPLKGTIVLKYHKNKVRIRYEDILYIRNVGNVVKVFDTAGNTYYHSATLARTLKDLPAERFSRVNRSAVVNCEMIDKIANQTIFIRNESFPLSRTYALELMERFDRS